MFSSFFSSSPLSKNTLHLPCFVSFNKSVQNPLRAMGFHPNKCSNNLARLQLPRNNANLEEVTGMPVPIIQSSFAKLYHATEISSWLVWFMLLRMRIKTQIFSKTIMEMQGTKSTFNAALPQDIKSVTHTMLTSHLWYRLEGQYI